MPRNMITSNAALFTALAVTVGELVSPEVRRQKRAVRTNHDERRWLQRLTLRVSSHLFLGPSSKIALGAFEDNFYIIAIGVEIVNPPLELERVAVNAGIFTAIASELSLPVLSAVDLSERLREYVFYPVEGPVELFDMEVIRPYFQRFEIFRVDSASALALDSELGLRAAMAAIMSAPGAMALQWPAITIERLKYMIRDPQERAPFHLLLRALTEVRDDAAFLSIYRCIEQLFPIPAIAELSTALGLSGPALQIATAIEHHLGWRRREEEAITHLFSELDTSLVERMLGVVGVAANSESRSRPVAKRIYELRNQCVHYRPIHSSDGIMPFSDWLALSDLMLEAVQCLYARYAGAFDESRVKIAV